MHVFKVLFLYFRENWAVFSSSSAWIVRTCVETISDWISQKNTLQRMSMTAIERYYTKHQPNEDDPCLKLRCYARERFFFSVTTFHLFNDRSSLGFQSLPDRSRKSVTNELSQELCKITSILLVQIIGYPYFFNQESLTLLTIYKIWWNEKNLTVRSYLFLTFSFLVPSNSGSGCNG